jgi:hypothetical protein
MGLLWVGEDDVVGLTVGPLGGRDLPEPARLVVLERLGDLGPGVHDEGAVVHDGLTDRASAEDEELEIVVPALLAGVGCDPDRVAGAEHHELVVVHGRPLGTCDPAPREHIDERVEVGPPRQDQPGTGAERGVEVGMDVWVTPGPRWPATSPAMTPAVTRTKAPPSDEDNRAAVLARRSW